MTASRSFRVVFGRRLAAMVATLVAVLVAAPQAFADFGITEFDGAVTANPAGDPYTQAGGHPFEASTDLKFNSHVEDVGFGLVLDVPDADAKTVKVHLPAGFAGKPTAMAKCEPEDFFATASGSGGDTNCPIESQVGIARLAVASSPIPRHQPLYNLRPATADVPAAFGFELLKVRVVLEASVRSESDYGVTVTTRNISQGLQVPAARITLWGVPGDPRHDRWRCKGISNFDAVPGCNGEPGDEYSGPHSLPGAPKALLTLPTRCTAPGVGLETVVEADSWASPGVFVSDSFFSHLPPGFPAPSESWGAQQGPEGCERLPFDPSISVQPTSRVADSPTGLEVNLTLPQDGLDNPDGLATAHLKGARVVLPEGMSISPSAAHGLAACSDEQVGFGNTDAPACPKASRIGSVVATTPVLEDPLTGDVFIATQRSQDPESGEMFRLFLTLKGPGVRVKLRGHVRANPDTGRLETTFDDNPQVPVDSLRLRLKDGPTAPLATPSTCGQKTVDVTLSSWAGQVVKRQDSFTIDCPGSVGFSPSFAAGTVNPVGGAFSPLAVRIARDDRQQSLSGVSLDMPEGLLAKLRGVPQCNSAQATDGGCPEGSRIGTVTVSAGPGSNPFVLDGPVYLTEGYKGAPFGLAAHVHAKAGPFDLGWVRVRQALHVDPDTAQVSVISDPLPQIVKGVPVRLRSIDVDVNRPGFALNPTSCADKQIAATLTSIDGATHKTNSHFQVGDCAALAFKPRLAMRLSGKRQTRTGGHPGLRTVLTQGNGQANIGMAKVTLPKTVALDAVNSADPKLVCDYDRSLKADCPASSIIGKATAQTPVLNRPLTGNVHLVQGIKFGPKGNRIRTYPSLLVKLRGEVAIDLRARTNVSKDNLLETTFPAVPDAPVSKFTLKINGGKKGILVVTRTRRSKINLCTTRQTASVETDGHNGKRADYATTVKTPCATKASKAKRKRK